MNSLRERISLELTKTPTSLLLQGYDFSNPDDYKILLEYPQVEHLYVGWTNFNDVGLEIISSLTNITMLHLAGTEITNEGLRHLVTMHKLGDLVLKENEQLTDECLIYLKQITALHTLHLASTSISVSALLELKVLPNMDALILDEDMIAGKSDEQKLREILETLSKHWPGCEIRIKGYGMVSDGKWD